MCSTSMGGPSTTPEKIDISEQCRPVFWPPRYSTPNWLVKLVGNVHYASQPWKGMNWIRNTDLFVIVEMFFVETSVPMRLCFYEDKIWNNESKRRSISWDVHGLCKLKWQDKRISGVLYLSTLLAPCPDKLKQLLMSPLSWQLAVFPRRSVILRRRKKERSLIRSCLGPEQLCLITVLGATSAASAPPLSTPVSCLEASGEVLQE